MEEKKKEILDQEKFYLCFYFFFWESRVEPRKFFFFFRESRVEPRKYVGFSLRGILVIWIIG